MSSILESIANKYSTSKRTDPECIHYLSLYNRYFDRLRHERLNILEIGVKDGESIRLWRDFFTNSSSIITGIDIKSSDGIDKIISEIILSGNNGIRIAIGDQSDENFLASLVKECGVFDIIIDDGSHRVDDQKNTFLFLFETGLSDNGIYVIEDLGTSYWPDYGGGYLRNSTTIEFIKDFIDDINYRFHRDRTSYMDIPDKKDISISYLENHIVGMHIHRGICFIEKGDNSSI